MAVRLPDRTQVVLAIAVGLGGWPGRAVAHPALDEALRAYEEARFDDALAEYGRAATARDLGRDDLARLLEGRALVLFAMGASREMELDLLRLATLEPDHELGPEVPPPVSDAFERLRGSLGRPLRLEVTAVPVSGAVRLRTRIDGDAGGLVAGLLLAARRPGEEWRRSASGRLDVAVHGGGAVEYFARALGPGGVVVAARGSADAPLRVRLSPPPERARSSALTGGDRDGGGGGRVPALVWIGGGAVLAAAAVAVVLLVTYGGSDDTQMSAPVLVP